MGALRIPFIRTIQQARTLSIGLEQHIATSLTQGMIDRELTMKDLLLSMARDERQPPHLMPLGFNLVAK